MNTYWIEETASDQAFALSGIMRDLDFEALIRYDGQTLFDSWIIFDRLDQLKRLRLFPGSIYHGRLIIMSFNADHLRIRRQQAPRTPNGKPWVAAQTAAREAVRIGKQAYPAVLSPVCSNYRELNKELLSRFLSPAAALPGVIGARWRATLRTAAELPFRDDAERLELSAERAASDFAHSYSSALQYAVTESPERRRQQLKMAIARQAVSDFRQIQKDFGLSMNDIEKVTDLYKRGVSDEELASHMRTSPRQVSRWIDRLVAAGLVDRREK